MKFTDFRIVVEKTKYYEYAFQSPYSRDTVAICRQLKDELGWKEFCYYDGKWRFKDPSVALTIRDRFPSTIIAPEIFEHIKAVAEYNRHREEVSERAEQLKSLTMSDIEISGIRGNLYPYQKIGVEFFINSGGRAMLCDEPGCGKTAQVLAYLVHTKKKRSLVVCPASVKFSWESEVEKWTKLKSQVIDGKTDFRTIDHDTNIVIANYDILKKQFNELMKMEWDCLIADESHFIKNNAAQRTKAFKAIAKNAKSLLLLSGTPVLSRPVELWNALQLMDEKKWTNYWDFTRRYCAGHQTRWGWEAKGATNLEELQRLISPYFLRRRKVDILKDLPEKVFVDVPISLDKESRTEYITAERELVRYLKEYKNKKAWEIDKAMNGQKLTKINMLRQISVGGKVKMAEELIESIIESGQKVLVFSSFNNPLKQLQSKFPGSVMITGETPVNERGDIIKRFQTDPDTNVFLGGIMASGTGITLTAASYVIFLDYSWNPADIEQALNRAHRPGATAERLTIYHMFAKNTIDEFMKDLLIEKQEIFDALIDSDIKKEEKSTRLFEEHLLSLYED